MHSSTQISHAGIIFDADSDFKSDFRGFDFLPFLGIKSESNHISNKICTFKAANDS